MPQSRNDYEAAKDQDRLWTPDAERQGIALWFDAQDPRTIALASGVISRIVNKGGIGLDDAAQATSGNRPTFSATALGPWYPGIVHAAASVQYLNLPSLMSTGWTAAEILYVAKRNTDPPATESTTGPLFVSGTAPGSGGEHEPYTDGNVYLATFSAARSATGNPALSLVPTRIINIRSASAAWSYWVDGAQHYSTGSNTFALPGTPTIGWSTAFGNNYSFDGVWGELIVFPSILSNMARARYFGYLAWKHGLADNPLSNFLFKNRPPLIGD